MPQYSRATPRPLFLFVIIWQFIIQLFYSVRVYRYTVLRRLGSTATHCRDKSFCERCSDWDDRFRWRKARLSGSVEYLSFLFCVLLVVLCSVLSLDLCIVSTVSL
jgi:hypothetical protein